MNLNRAKTVLIVAFLSLNLFLAYHLLLKEAGRLPLAAVSVKELQLVEERLAQSNYFLQASVRRGVQKSAFLSVTPDLSVQVDLLNRLAGQETVAYNQEGVSFYQGQEMEVKIHSTGLVQLTFKPGLIIQDGAAQLEQKELLQRVELALRARHLLPHTARFDYMEVLDRCLIIHYYQDYKGTPLFAGYLKVFVNGDQINSIEFYWLEPLEQVPDQEMAVIPVTEALLRLIEDLGVSPRSRRIIKAELGYFSREYNAEKWEIPPVWRFLTDDSVSYYVNAFTGNLETDQ
ncbi:MAG: two-component system regulatory protein YycI [Bacillota bacterium]